MTEEFNDKKTKEKERLAKIIATAGICSRRRAEELVASGKVEVNGKTVTDPAMAVDSRRDLISVDGELLEFNVSKTYIALHKPRGYITSTSDPEGRPTVMKLLPDGLPRLYPVGRLDWDSEGLIIITNDGELANALLRPQNKVTKTYEAKVKGAVSKEQIQHLKKGIMLKDGLVVPVSVRFIKKAQKNSWVRITITSGKNHIVKRMFQVVNLDVIRLKRIEMAGLMLGSLPCGAWCRIKPKEIKRMWSEIKKAQSAN